MGDVLHDHALEHGQIFNRRDVVQAQVVTASDIGHHGHITPVKGQPFAQHAAAGGFQHGCIHVGVLQHIARTFGAAAVTGVDALTRDVDTIRVGHAHAQAVLGQQVRDQAHGGGLAIGAGDGHQRNAAILMLVEHAGDDGLTHRAPLAVGRRQVHAQTGRGIDLDHATALFFERMQDAVADNVHAANIESHHACGSHGTGCHFRVHAVGDIGGGAAGGQIGVVAQGDALAFGGHGVGIKPLACQARQSNIVKSDFGQRGRMARAAARVFVDLFHHVTDGVLAITHHVGRFTISRRHQLVANHQQAKVVAGNVAFDQDVIAELGGCRVSRCQLFTRRDVDRHALALVATLGFDHHRQTDFTGGHPGIFRGIDLTAERNRHARRSQQFFGQLFVLGDRFRNGTGDVHFGGLDAALLAAPAEHDHAALRHAAKGNVARNRRLHDGARARPQAYIFVEFAQALQRLLQIEGGVVLRRQTQGFGQLQGQAAHRFF